MTGDEILRIAAAMGAERGCAFLTIHFETHPEDLIPTIKAGRDYYDGILREFRPGTPQSVQDFMVHLQESLL